VTLRIWSRGEVRDVKVAGGGPSGLRLVRTASPLLCQRENLLGELPLRALVFPPGSYLFVLREEGFEDLRVPVYLDPQTTEDDRSTRIEVRAAMLPDGASPEGYIWVPPGPFLGGGDSQALRPMESGVRELPGFWIARTETTVSEYLGFVNDPATRAEIAEAEGRGTTIRVPRNVSARETWKKKEDGLFVAPQDGRWPITGVSWDDAVAYCRWKSTQAKGRGERWFYELPTEEEWEKAARGVDGRKFPWGDTFDWSYFLGGLSRPDVGHPEPVGRFVRGASPSEVLDMAGSAMEWCGGWVREGEAHPQRGGAWAFGSIQYFRSAGRGPRHSSGYAGFRLVARKGPRD
jgi:formylglycine-generating enzyme required for sulfatase activity